jgi:hypothetical protein
MKTNIKSILYSILVALILVTIASLEISKDIQLGYGKTLYLETTKQKIAIFVIMSIFFYFMFFKKRIKNEVKIEGFRKDKK